MWHWYHLLLIVDLCFSYLIWKRFWSYNLTVFNGIFRGKCFCVWLFVVYNFCWYFCLLCFHICSIISFLRICFTAIFMILLCLLIYLGSMWFWWLTVSMIDDFMIVTDVSDFSCITLYLKIFILFWFYFFTFNQDYLTLFLWPLC